MKVGLDTSVVIRLITGEPAPQAVQAARTLSEALAAQSAVEVSDLALAETYFALQHHYAMPKPEALQALALFTAEDVDGPSALPLRLDGEVPNLGKFAACRRVARTIYLSSAPTATAANRGIEDRRIRLGCMCVTASGLRLLPVDLC